MTISPVENLELEAMEQRNRLHDLADQLRVKLEATREKLSISKQAHKHFVAASLLVAVIGLGLGYGLAGMFTRY